MIGWAQRGDRGRCVGFRRIAAVLMGVFLVLPITAAQVSAAAVATVTVGTTEHGTSIRTTSTPPLPPLLPLPPRPADPNLHASSAISVTRLANGREAVANRIVVVFRNGTKEAERQDVHSAVSAAGIPVSHVSQISFMGLQGPLTDVVSLASGLDSVDASIRAYSSDAR